MRERKDLFGVRALGKGFLKEVAVELCLTGWGQFWSGDWKRGAILGVERSLRTRLGVRSCSNKCDCQSPLCAKSIAVNIHKEVFYFYHYHYFHFINEEAETQGGYVTSTKPQN